MRTVNLEASEAAAWSLKRLEWQFFITMTYGFRPDPVKQPDKFIGSTPPPFSIRSRMVFQFLRVVNRSFKCGKDPLWNLQAAIRNESGEKGGRAHHHCLLTIPNLTNPSKSDCFRIKSLWQFYCGRSAGFADVRLFNSQLAGEDYLAKVEGSDGANSYELGKFGLSGDRTLILTPNVIWQLHKKRSHMSRNQGRQSARLLRVLKRDRSQNVTERKAREHFWAPERFDHPAWVVDSRSGS